ncbi:hypothetical protein T08_8488 [Trichinella sp. T8]|nr:hypothetical protein T08_8488 [Trichinella sp. T8]
MTARWPLKNIQHGMLDGCISVDYSWKNLARL